MAQILNLLKKNKTPFLIGLAWILVWILPWGKLLSVEGNIFLVFVVDMLKLGIALFLFIIPGMLLYVLIKRADEQRFGLPGILPIGFTLSVTIIAVIGLTGRLLGLSFSVVKYSFALIGLVEIVLLMKQKPDFRTIGNHVKTAIQSSLRNAPLVLTLILATLMTFHDYLFFIDDTTYLAYLTNWQYSEQLGFKNIVHVADVVERARFWLAMNPMWQAVLADLSGLPGLVLLGNYLELFLVPLAVVTAYWFARALGFSKKKAGFAVLIQITLYAWMVGDHYPVGMWFYQSMSEDKVIAAFCLCSRVFFCLD